MRQSNLLKYFTASQKLATETEITLKNTNDFNMLKSRPWHPHCYITGIGGL